MDGQPPTLSLSTRAWQGHGWPDCPLGSWHACLKAASSWTQLEAPCPPRISLWCCPGFRPCCLCRASLSASQDSPHACFPVCSSSPSHRQGTRKNLGGGGSPLGMLDLESGKWEPWTPGDALFLQQPQGNAREDETAACVVSACQVRQENWRGCWRRGWHPAGLCRQRGTLAALLQPLPSPHLPIHLPTPTWRS